MPKALVTEFPRFFTRELGDGREDAAFNRHLPMELIIFVKATEPLNGKTVKDYAPTRGVNVPPRHSFAINVLEGAAGHVEVNTFEFRRPQ